MPKKRLMTGLLLATVTLLYSPVFASSLSIVNPDFSVPAIPCGLDYAYQGAGTCSSTTGGGNPFPQQNFNGVSGFGWTFAVGGDGLTGPGTPFNPPSFTSLPFTQAAFLQGNSADISQGIAGFSVGGAYVLNFYLGSRFNSVTDGNQTVEALLNGNVVGTWALTSSTPFTLESAAFTGIANGSETLEFKGLASGDHTAFLSHVSISSVPEPVYLPFLTIGLIGLGAIARLKRRFF